MKHNHPILLIAVFVVSGFVAVAQLNSAVTHLGIGAGVVLPTGDLSNSYSMGYEFHAKSVSHLSEHFAIGAHAGMQLLAGKTVTDTDPQMELPTTYDDELSFVLSAGPEYRQDNWFLGVHIGYIAGDNLGAEMGLIPTAGLQLGGLQIGARFKLLGDYSWLGAGLTYYFIKW